LVSDENPVRVIGRVQENLHTGQSTLSPENLTTLSMEMRCHLADGPRELRQADMRLLLDHVMVGHHSVRPKALPHPGEACEPGGCPLSLSSKASLRPGSGQEVVERYAKGI
jgi:hypothetical protein